MRPIQYELFLVALYILLVAYRFWNSARWRQLGEPIRPNDPQAKFSKSLSLSADGRIIATIQDSKNIVTVYEYNKENQTWVGNDIVISTYKVSTKPTSVEMTPDAKFLVVGIYDGRIGGTVCVYKFSESTWMQVGEDIVLTPDDSFGVEKNASYGVSRVVALPVSITHNGNTLAVGAPSTDRNGAINAGLVRVYDYLNGTWMQRGLYSELEGQNDDDNFGIDVSLSGNGRILAVGAYESTADFRRPGRAHVFEWTGDKWSQMGQTLYGKKHGDLFGISLSLSLDGNTVAVGAPYSDHFVWSNAGQVRIFKFEKEENEWIQLGHDVNGHDNFGRRLQLTADGLGFCTGAPYHRRIKEEAGQVWVYRYDSVVARWKRVAQVLEGGPWFGASCAIARDGHHVAGVASCPYCKESYVCVFELDETYYNPLAVTQKL